MLRYLREFLVLLLFVLPVAPSRAANVIDSIQSLKNGDTNQIRYTIQTRYYQAVDGQRANNDLVLYDTLGRVIFTSSLETPSIYERYKYDRLDRKIEEFRSANGDHRRVFYCYGDTLLDSIAVVQYNVDHLPATFHQVAPNSLGQYRYTDTYWGGECVYDHKAKTHTTTQKPILGDRGQYHYFVDEMKYGCDSMNRLVVEEGPVGYCKYIYKDGGLHQLESEAEGYFSILTYNEQGRAVLRENFDGYYPDEKLEDVSRFEYDDDHNGNWVQRRQVSTTYHRVVDTVYRKIVYY